MTAIRPILFIVLCFLAFTGIAQQSNNDLFTGRSWKIQSDEMSGVGVHTSLQDGTVLQFLDDGTWKSSPAINNVESGSWRLENNERNLILKSGKEEKRYLILKLTEKELHYKVKKNAATYTYKWLSME